MLTHRRDIDGLRAFAVVPVVLFHSGLGLCPGGYVGVDVFFVISGFLITGLLLRDIDAGRFSLVDFYERRIRRLFPALFAMLTCAAAAAWWLLPPTALREFGRSLTATTAFASNIYYWLESGYFAPAAEDMPLLHTWSLAVEEQYYVLFPLLLWLLARGGRRLMLCGIGGLTVLSFAAAVWLIGHEPDHAFYLAHARAWELFIGALVACRALPPATRRITREGLAGAGLAAILGSVFSYDALTPFPGVAAALPCLGAAAIIHAGTSGDSTTARLLGSRFTVGIGLISYSLYLWHWPVFVFLRQYTILPPSTLATLGALAFTVTAAAISWRFVEQPFRGRAALVERRGLFAGATAVLVLFAGLGLAAHVTGGFPSRFRPEVLAIAASTSDNTALRARCFGLDATGFAANRMCHLGPADMPPEYLVWGDSHSLAMLETLMAEADRRRRPGVYLGASGCPPAFGVGIANRSRAVDRQCRDTAAQARSVLAATPSIRTVLLIARWGMYVEATGFGGIDSEVILLTDDAHPQAAPDTNHEIVEAGLIRTLPVLMQQQRRVEVLSSVPETAFNVPRAMAQAAGLGRQVDLGSTRQAFDQRQRRTTAMFNRLQSTLPGFEVLPTADRLCNADRCMVALDGQPLYYDDNHLSALGARLLVGTVETALGWQTP